MGSSKFLTILHTPPGQDTIDYGLCQGPHVNRHELKQVGSQHKEQESNRVYIQKEQAPEKK